MQDEVEEETRHKHFLNGGQSTRRVEGNSIVGLKLQSVRYMSSCARSTTLGPS